MRRKLFLLAALALGALAAGSATATAFTAVFSPAGSITMISLGMIGSSSGEVLIHCFVTMRGIINREVTLTSGVAMGQIQSVITEQCTNATTVTSLLLPWGIVYSSALGTLPDNGTGLSFRIVGASFKYALFGGFLNCLYRGDQPALLGTIDTGTNTYRTGLITLIGAPLRKVEGFGCPSETELEGVFGITSQTITVR